MPTAKVLHLIAEHRKSAPPVLDLLGLSDVEIADLMRVPDAFHAVEELRIHSSDRHWIFGGLTAFANHLKKLSRLNLSGSLDLSDLGLRVIAENLTTLVYLDLAYCSQVTDAGVAAIAHKLTALATLILRACTRVTDVGVAAVADKLTGLAALDLAWCEQVTDAGVRGVVDKLALTTFDLGGCNQVTDVGVAAVADKLTALTTFSLWDCKRVTDAGVVAVAENLTALASFDLGGCDQVTDAGVVAVAENLTALARIHFSGNQVTDAGVVAVAENLTALTHFSLRNCNQVTDAGVVAVAENLTALTHLSLRNCNQVTDAGVVAVAESLTALVHLNLQGCEKVTALPESMGRLQNLEALGLNGTRLAKLPVALRDLSRLRHLSIDNTSDLKLPEELTGNTANPRAILDHYFRGRHEGRRTLNEAKLILVGNEAVGKTSLVNFLVHKKPCKDTAKTLGVKIVEGVDVKSWNVDKSDAGDTPLTLNVWDFGGQQVLYETHQFFLTARSLYLIVLEARRENANEQEANLHAWLRSIRTRTVQPVPVIVVINKSEPPHDLRLDEARLIHEFPNIRNFIRTSCRDPKKHADGGRGIDELRKTIVDVIRTDLPHVRDQIPVSYFNIKSQLAKTARRSFILNTKDYRKKCAAQNVTETREQNDLLTLLDCIGMVVKYDDTTLLDPNWLTTAVYQVLTHEAVVKSEGQFARSDLGKLLAGLSAKDYPPERWPFIAEMMKRFGLSFELPGQPDCYLLPNQLPVNDPQPPWDEKDSLRFRYEYRHTPSHGLLPRLIVQGHRHLTSPRVAWLAGVVLGVQSCSVLVRMNRQERRVNISVRGPKNKRRDALSVIREYFGSVHALNRFEPNTDFTAQVPVDVPNKPDAAFDFEELETYERNGVDTILYKGCDHKFSVKELLAGVGPEPMQHNRSADRVYNDNRVTYLNNSGTMTATAINDSDVLAGKVDVSIDPHWRHQTDQ